MLAFSSLAFVLLGRRRPELIIQAYLQFAADLVAVLALVHASGGMSSGFGGLLIISVGSLGLLMRRDLAFAFAAIATLGLLLEQAFAQASGLTGPTQFVQAGILGAVIFVITIGVQLLRHRAVETEALAEQRGIDLRNEVQLNQYIVRHLRESIVVVDGDGRIRLLNESAITHLGTDASATGRPLASVAPELARYLELWRRLGPEYDKRPVTLSSADESTHVQPHFAPLGGDRGGAVVIFLEDTSVVAERVQQTKLAALGRLSASIAHEIRNPLGALSHAGQLLGESEGLTQDEQRLTDIIRANAKRVSKILESVLALSKRDTTSPQQLDLKPWLTTFANEFVETQELFEGSVAVAPESTDVDVKFDPTQLHQVLWNLCDNAIKYASADAGAIAVELTCGAIEASGRPYVDVADRGAGVETDKAEQIFEPFYTGSKGGTGLGLYICKELCERNGAQLRYDPRPGGGSRFRIIFADPTRWQLTGNGGNDS
jgi:two-component system sensor histidine kinase PilS (NtrC family)